MNKKLIIVLAGVAIIGGGYYLYKRKKDSSGVDEKGNSTKGGKVKVGGIGKLAPSALSAKERLAQKSGAVSSPSELSDDERAEVIRQTEQDMALANKRSQKKIAKKYQVQCGKRPALKKNRPAWEACIREVISGESSGFDGAHSNNFEPMSSFTEFEPFN